VALVGRNGAGKSTIVKLLGRLYDPDDGVILIDGRDVREYDPVELRREFGVMFQDYAAYQVSAGENIGVGNVDHATEQTAIAKAAERAGADDVIRPLPEGYDTTLGKQFEGGHQLSGGEWQKIALARAFMRDSQVLILDEPTAALDAQAEHNLFARIKELTRGKMALYISHRFSTVRMADRILFLERAVWWSRARTRGSWCKVAATLSCSIYRPRAIGRTQFRCHLRHVALVGSKHSRVPRITWSTSRILLLLHDVLPSGRAGQQRGTAHHASRCPGQSRLLW
jgi:ABC-type transport system involved in cytochrome bd biosynthesis fused ATPase/permease subunit